MSERVTLAEVEAFLRESGLAASRFGRMANGDPALVRNLRAGRQPGRKISATLRGFMAGWQSAAQTRLPAPRQPKRRDAAMDARDREVATAYAAGERVAAIGERYVISAERVRQIAHRAGLPPRSKGWREGRTPVAERTGIGEAIRDVRAKVEAALAARTSLIEPPRPAAWMRPERPAPVKPVRFDAEGKAWCDQCLVRMHKTDAAACRSPFCKLKGDPA